MQENVKPSPRGLGQTSDGVRLQSKTTFVHGATMVLQVRIASFDNLPVAQFAQQRLADEGIPSFLDNATVVSWFWPIRDAVGGLKLLVEHSDVELAREALTFVNDGSADVTRCPTCGEPLEPGWQVCWKCGDPDHHDLGLATASARNHVYGSVLESISTETMRAALISICGACILATFGLSGLLIWVIALVAFVAGSSEATGHQSGETSDDLSSSVEEPASDHYVFDHIAARAMYSSVFGLTTFPPLTLYAFWLLNRISAHRNKLSSTGRWWRRSAWWIVFWTFMLYGWLIFVVPSMKGNFPYQSYNGPTPWEPIK